MTTKNLIEKFILLAYADIFNNRTYDMVGIEEDPTVLRGYSFDNSSKKYHPVLEFKHAYDIHLVIPCDFDGTGETSYLLVSKDGDTFRNTIYFRSTKETVALADTVAAPFLYTNEDLRPCLLLQLPDRVVSCVIEDKKPEITNFEYYTDLNAKKKTTFENDVKVHPRHTSVFTDLTGNLKPDLGLVISKGGVMMLRILENTTKGFVHIQDLDVSKARSPLVFLDLNGNGTNDLFFIGQNGNGDYEVVVYFNNNERINIKEYRKGLNFVKNVRRSDTVFSNDNVMVDLFSTYFTLFTPVFKLDGEADLLSGLYVADPKANGTKDVFIRVKNNENVQIIVALSIKRSDVGNKVSFVVDTDFEFLKKGEKADSRSRIHSISFADIEGVGREAFVINDVENGTSNLYMHHNELSKENMKLSLSTIIPGLSKGKYGCTLPGVSYLISYDSGKKLAIAAQMTQSSFLHMNHLGAFTGLGMVILFIDNLMISLPASGYKIEYIRTRVIPNMDLILYPDLRGNFQIESYFRVTKHLNTILIVLITVASVNLIAVFYFFQKDRRRRKEAKSVDHMQPLFATLQ